jgi:hypothetical protein
MKNYDPAKKFFSSSVTDRERAVFEAGIKMATIYHQFIGTPIPKNKPGCEILKKAIEESIKTQPWVKDVKINLITNKPTENRYKYAEIKSNNIEAVVIISYGKVEVEAELRFIDELLYPLAFIRKIIEN